MIERDNYYSLKKEMKKIYKTQKQAFGEGKYYQSLPVLGIEGHRPTDYRISQYHIEEYLSPNDNVLDIGCNVGFFDIEIADKVNSIVGVEYNDSLVKIAQIASKGLGVNNTKFYCEDFEAWSSHHDDTYSVIFSFAVHMWLKIPPAKYASILDRLLSEGGGNSY